MRVLVDSDVMIDILRGVADARDSISGLRSRGDGLLSVTPVRTEILRGVDQPDLKRAEDLLAVLGWIDVDVSLADRAATIGRRYQHSHGGVQVVDLLLAAAAEMLEARVLTRNVRHFPMIPGLQPAY